MNKSTYVTKKEFNYIVNGIYFLFAIIVAILVIVSFQLGWYN